jgi:hypothetical protein
MLMHEINVLWAPTQAKAWLTGHSLWRIPVFAHQPKSVWTHIGDSAGKSIFSGHRLLWDGDLQQQYNHDVPLCQLRVWYINYLSAPQTYNPNVVDRSHVVISVSSSHVNMHNSYSSTDMSRWSNHNAYMFEHVSNIHNGFVPPYSSTEPASHCTPQIHMSMSNYYSRTDLRTLTDFDQSLYTAQIQLEWRLHRIWFQHHLSCLVCSIWLHLFIAE